ncbi:transposase [Pseudomonadota bacterium]
MGDSGFCGWRIRAWCERHSVDCIVGVAKNKRLNVRTTSFQYEAEDCFSQLQTKVRLFTELDYGARSWDHPLISVTYSEY